WLALAVVLIFAVPALTFGVVGGVQLHNLARAGGTASSQLSAGASSWNDPAWRRRTGRQINQLGAAFTLVRHQRILFSSGAGPLAHGNTVEVRSLAPPGAPPGEVAYLYTSGPPWAGGNGTFFFPLAGLIALAVTLGLLAWFFGRTLVRPLAATGDAARRIAAGELDIAIPDSRISEVSELRNAFAGMSAELGRSLRHQAELEEQRRLFLGAIAHDLRTPLFALRGYLEGLEQGVATTPEQRREYVHVAREKADALERLVADLFAYARVEYLDNAMERESLDAGCLVARIAEGRTGEADTRGISLRVGVETDHATVQADRRLLERALENVVDNALRYSGRGSEIVLSVASDGEWVTVTVADSGPGISADDLSHIFEPMYRDMNRGGSGLGLAVSRRILRAHGGDITAGSGEDGGAVLRISIPATPNDGVSIQATAESTSRP
ncbi:MAG TPA: HAMP domain-containing sensor histidine kinase, partial [Chloroflexota bacterium]|nr:HAMP domain-containing sensor histidine kinase [Chloroflexota bacterium]